MYEYVRSGDKLHLPINKNGLGIEMYESLLKHQMACNHKKIALIDAKTKESLTYSELLHKTLLLAQALERQGFDAIANDYIAVFSENHINFFVPIIAALYLGVPVSPINFNYTGDELLHVLRIAKPKLVFTSSSVLSKLLQIRPKCTWMRQIVLLDCDVCAIEGVTTLNEIFKSVRLTQEFRPRSVDCATHTLGILCSSGTTGLPKGVELTHQNILVRIIQMQDPRFNDRIPDDSKLGFLPFFHGYGFVATLGNLVAGDKVIVMSRFEEELFLHCIQEHQIRTLYVVPPIVVTLAKSSFLSKYNLTSLKTMYSGAAPLDAKVETLAKQRLRLENILQGYGLTEATQATLSFPLPIRGDKPGSSGVVLPGMCAAIMDLETGVLLPANRTGELCFKGPSVMKGYLHNAEATMESFKNGWLLTGDIGYYDDDGYFYIIDRRKELIKYKSFQVAPAELEATLLTHGKIKDAAVIGIPDVDAGELPLAFVVKQDDSLTEAEVKQFIEKRVSNAKRLRGGVRFVHTIPKNPSGKILRRELRTLAAVKSKY